MSQHKKRIKNRFSKRLTFKKIERQWANSLSKRFKALTI